MDATPTTTTDLTLNRPIAQISSEPGIKAPLEFPPYPLTVAIHHLKTELDVDDALAPIKDGVVGFDTEFVKRIPTAEEAILDNLWKAVGGSRKTMLLAWQVLEMEMNATFPVAWGNIALCTIQLARGQDVWIINLNIIKAYPTELERVLRSPDIIKAGVGLGSDVPHLWGDLRTDMQNMVDVGLMAKLLFAHHYGDQPYGNLSLQNCAAYALGYYVSKEERVSDWKGQETNGDLDDAQVAYAATDAAVSLHLYEVLAPALETKARQLRVSIPRNWYTTNSKYGELMRKYSTIWGDILPWAVKDCYWFSQGKFMGYT
ncbi:ribonuclease H-like domain-containing protein [Mycena capillaripes]|nr:ribonuclease H-like domain-containing protein [Mycena capillaripes]